MKWQIISATMLTAFLVPTAGCPPPKPQPPPNDASDAAPELTDASPSKSDAAPATVDASPQDANTPDVSTPTTCEAACSTLARLGCPEAHTPDGGKSCLKVCEDAEASKKFSLKPACIAGAQSAEGVRSCGSVRCQK